jgi:hypothetical protein
MVSDVNASTAMAAQNVATIEAEGRPEKRMLV